MIFPTLSNTKFGYVNLNQEAIKWMASQTDARKQEKNPLLNPDYCQRMVEDVHKKYSLDFSFGGWMEDRSFLWRGNYLEQGKTFTHLGVDINVPYGTEVAADFEGSIVKIDSDFPEDGGWGTRIIIRHSSAPIYMIYAHLDKDVVVKVGDKITKGAILAKVGKAPHNGNWFQHLHVQTISAGYFEELSKNNSWEDLDGYGTEEDIGINSERFADPMNYICLNSC